MTGLSLGLSYDLVIWPHTGLSLGLSYHLVIWPHTGLSLGLSYDLVISPQLVICSHRHKMISLKALPWNY